MTTNDLAEQIEQLVRNHIASAWRIEGRDREEEMSTTFRTEIEIDAAPDTVFDYFVHPDKLVRWMGDFARLDAIAGGLFSVDINGVLIRGSYVRIERPHLIEIAWGEASKDRTP